MNKVNETTPMGMPEAYKNLGMCTGYNPLDASMTRHCTLGPSGGGKTSFWASCPRTLILDFEKGANAVPGIRAFYVPIGTYEALEKITDQLVKDRNSKVVDRVVFDTVDAFLELLKPVLTDEYQSRTRAPLSSITEYGQKGAGWNILKNRMWSFVQKIEEAGYSWSIVAHQTEAVITEDGKDRTVIRTTMSPSVRALIFQNCDFISCIHRVTKSRPTVKKVPNGKGGTREIAGPVETYEVTIMDTTDTGAQFGNMETKSRGVPTLQAQIELPPPLSGKAGWDNFVEAYNKAIEDVRAKLS